MVFPTRIRLPAWLSWATITHPLRSLASLRLMLRLVGGAGAMLLGVALCRYATFLTVSENLAFYYGPDFVDIEPPPPITASGASRVAAIREKAVERSFFQNARRASTLKEEDGKLRRSFDESESETIRYLRKNTNSASDLLEEFAYGSVWDLLLHLTILDRPTDEFNVIKAWTGSGIGLDWSPGCDPSADCSENQINSSGYIDYLQEFFADHLAGMVRHYRCDDAAALATALTRRLIVIRSPRGPELDLRTRRQKSKMLLLGIFLSNPVICQRNNDAADVVLTAIEAADNGFLDEIVPEDIEQGLVVPMARYLRYLALFRDHKFGEAAATLASIDAGPSNTLFTELIVLQMARVIFWNWQASGEQAAPITISAQSNFFRSHPALPPAKWSTRASSKDRSAANRLTELLGLLKVPSFQDDVADYIQIVRNTKK